MELKNLELLENLNYIQYQINYGIDKVIKYIYLKYIENETDDKISFDEFKKSILKPMRRNLNNNNNNNNS